MQSLWTEDLDWQAQRGLELGSALCACEGHYHTLWGSLRVAGLNNTMKGEAPHLTEMMAPLLRDGMRVLIAGAADPGVLCGIGRIFSPRMPAFTVIDKCKAPLALIGEFAASRAIACRALHMDLLDLDGSEQWDQIVLHYTADYMNASFRGRLFRSLAACLAPGGTLICATMTGASIPLHLQDDMAGAFYARAVAALKDTPMAAQAQTPEFEHKLHGYSACRTIRRLRLPTAEGICEFIQDAGLRVLQKHETARARRLLVGMDVVDTSSIIIASRS
jgi:hypothetical protein